MRRRQRSAFGLAVGLVLLLAALPVFAAEKAPASPVDVNSATADALKQVPGIGEATAKKIIAGRPYKSLDELTTKAGLPAKTVEKLKPMLSVGAAPAASAPPAAKAPAPAPAAKAPAAPAAKAPAAPAGPVDVNTASEAQLKEVPGIGEATARKIVAGRPYRSVDEVASKTGIPAKTVDKLKPMLTVGSAPAPAPAAPAPAAKAPASAAPAVPAAPAAQTQAVPAASAASKHAAPAAKLAPGQKVNINSAPKELLDALPGIGPVKAQAIIDGRPYSKIEDVMKVKGIKEGEFSKIKDLITVQ